MKRLLILTTVLILFLIPQLTFSSDLDEFKAAVEKLDQAYNSMDADTIAEMNYPGSVIIESDAPFPNVHTTPEALKEGLQNWFSTIESIAEKPGSTSNCSVESSSLFTSEKWHS